MYNAPKYPSHKCWLLLFFVYGIDLLTLMVPHCLQDKIQKPFQGTSGLSLKISF